MNSPMCNYHQQRKSEIICLNMGCDNRLSLMCMLCLHESRCKRHNWKIIQVFVQEILQSIEIEQSKEEKKVNSVENRLKEQIPRLLQKLRNELTNQIDQIVSAFKSRTDEIIDRSVNEKRHNVIKNIIKQFRKTEIREIQNLNLILKKIDNHITDDQHGVVHLAPVQNNSNNVQIQQKIVQIQNQVNQVLQTFKSNINGSKLVDESRQILQNQIKQYEDRLKQLPVLKSRIQSLNEKLKLKQNRIRLLQQKSDNKLNQQMNQILQKFQKQKVQKQKRIQSLLLLKQTIFKKVTYHCHSCHNDTYKIQRWYQKQKNVDIGNSYCEYGLLLNFILTNIGDDLLFLGYKQNEYGQSYIQIPIVQRKKASYREFSHAPYY